MAIPGQDSGTPRSTLACFGRSEESNQKEEEMKWHIRVAALASLLTFFTVAVTAYASAAPRTGATPSAPAVPTIILGKECQTVHSQNNWIGHICVMANYDDANGDLSVEALVSYSINSGSLREVYVGSGLYLRNCDIGGYCWNRGYESSPYKFTSGTSSSISTAWLGYNPYYAQSTEQAFVNTPCMIWTNGQVACYNGVMASMAGALKL
jgi:hypothetical protein